MNKELIVKQYRQGTKVSELSKIYGLHPSTIYGYINQHKKKPVKTEKKEPTVDKSLVSLLQALNITDTKSFVNYMVTLSK